MGQQPVPRDDAEVEDLEIAVSDLEGDLAACASGDERAEITERLEGLRARLEAARLVARNQRPGWGDAAIAAFRDPATRAGMLRMMTDIQFTIGDGTAVYLDDFVRVPDRFGGPRAGAVGRVVLLADDGLGLVFREAVGNIRREFFDWDEISGAQVSGIDRAGKRKSVTPPPAQPCQES